MKNLGPYRKYIVAAAIIQAIIVVIGGYILFKESALKDQQEHKGQEHIKVEEPLKRDS